MINLSNGYISISNELEVYPGFSFETFMKTKFFENQDKNRIIYLKNPQNIDNRNYIISLFFREGIIYLVSLICCDQEFSEQDERNRKDLHDNILQEFGLNPHMRYDWGEINSDYDAKGNISSINIIYSHE